LEAQFDPLRDARALELSNRAKDMQLQLAGRRGRIDALRKTHECDTE
jgi:hypothetical protein